MYLQVHWHVENIMNDYGKQNRNKNTHKKKHKMNWLTEFIFLWNDEIDVEMNFLNIQIESKYI